LPRCARSPAASPSHLTDLERRLLAAFVARLAAESPRISGIVLFGSRARARSTPESDIDLAVLVAGRRDRRLGLSGEQDERTSPDDCPEGHHAMDPVHLMRQPANSISPRARRSAGRRLA
jgi:predicted nucleotidyltransferase